jgi:hypothetical protein
MRRAERKEQEELAGRKKREAAQAKAQRVVELKEKKSDINAHPARVARPGKPLRR